MANKKPKCSFCGQVRPDLFSGEDGSYICPDCIEAGHAMLMRSMGQEPEPQQKQQQAKKHKPIDLGLSLESLPRPQDIKAFLDLYVIGQEDANICR